DLELSYRPAELRPALERALQERREVTLRGIPMDHSDGVRFLDIVLVPLYEDDGAVLGARISFSDVTPMKALEEELTHSKQELETAYEELQTMNDELRNRSTELNASNAFLEAVFTSLRSAVVVLDRELRVQVWNTGASDLWGLRAEEAERANFFGLDIGLPVADLHQPIKDVLSGAAPHREVTLHALTRKGRRLECAVSVSPLVSSDRAVTGVILLMEKSE
ncbi:MAG TPA: PAS domain-containing protein, partial [Vicinamibacterales bacterium]|nr:PAS domain-containing protein [Vicinamibacterales bacterium]